jgi:hypothetical protein
VARILFAFDPTREAILLVAGDKSGQSLRAYVTGLGGHLEIVARIGDIQLNAA